MIGDKPEEQAVAAFLKRTDFFFNFGYFPVMYVAVALLLQTLFLYSQSLEWQQEALVEVAVRAGRLLRIPFRRVGLVREFWGGRWS